MTAAPPGFARLARHAALGVGGAVAAVCALVGYRHAWVVRGLLVPWGLVLVLAAAHLGTVAAAVVERARSGAVAFGAGWLVVVLVGLTGRPEGDYLVAADGRGYTLLLGEVAAVALGIARAQGPSADPDRTRRSPRLKP